MKISVRVTDVAYGMSAADIEVALRQQTDADWVQLSAGRTDADGRLQIWSDGPLTAGTYQLVYDLDAYYAILGTIPLYPRAIVEFRVRDSDTELHLPLMITSNSYLTCREGA